MMAETSSSHFAKALSAFVLAAFLPGRGRCRGSGWEEASSWACNMMPKELMQIRMATWRLREEATLITENLHECTADLTDDGTLPGENGGGWKSCGFLWGLNLS